MPQTYFTNWFLRICAKPTWRKVHSLLIFHFEHMQKHLKILYTKKSQCNLQYLATVSLVISSFWWKWLPKRPNQSYCQSNLLSEKVYTLVWYITDDWCIIFIPKYCNDFKKNVGHKFKIFCVIDRSLDKRDDNQISNKTQKIQWFDYPH